MRVFHSVAAATLCVALLGVGGCTSQDGGVSDAQGSVESTRAYDNAVKVPPAAVQPPPAALTKDPRTSIYSYLLWISYAYRILDSSVAASVFSPYEEVRVDSYVQYNIQEGRAIDQQLQDLEFGEFRNPGEATATVPAVEAWKYRYIDMKTGKYKGDWLDATYDSTYTVIFDPGTKQWLVDSVKATPRGTVK